MNKKAFATIISFTLVFSIAFSAFTTVTQAQTSNPKDNAPATYTLLEPLPCLDSGSKASCEPGKQITRIQFKDYIRYAFNLMIALAGVAAVFMIVLGGFQYMSSDAYSGKKEGLTRLQNAIYGLLLVLCSYLILRTVDPRLVDIPTTLVKPLDITYKPNEVNPEKLLYDMISELEKLKIKQDNAETIQKVKSLDQEIADLKKRLTEYRENAGTIDESSDQNIQYLLQEINKREAEKNYSVGIQTLKNKYLEVDASHETADQIRQKITSMFSTYNTVRGKLESLGQPSKVRDLENHLLFYTTKTSMDVQLAMIQRADDPSFIRGVSIDYAKVMQTSTLGLLPVGNLFQQFENIKSEQRVSVALDNVIKISRDARAQITDPDLKNQVQQYEGVIVKSIGATRPK